MSYSEDYRKRTLEYRHEGHTLEETKRVFKIAASTICHWEKQLKEEGTLKKEVVSARLKKLIRISSLNM